MGSNHSRNAEPEDIVFVDGERIEIACTYSDVESAIKALHEGE